VGEVVIRMNKIFLSVLIPVYNFDIALLINSLCREINKKDLHSEIEIIVMDDASSPGVKEGNRIICQTQAGIKIKYYELEKNIGRAKIRNQLVSKARGGFILFLDDDGLPDSLDFLSEYLRYARQGKYEVICGGRSYQQVNEAEKSNRLYMWVSSRTEVKSAEERNRVPWRYIFTNNILLKKRVFTDTPFDERFVGWGYEDTEWGIRLCQNYHVTHIDNTVSHLGLKSKESLFRQRKESVKNHYLMATLYPDYFCETAVYKWVVYLLICDQRLLGILDKGMSRLYFQSHMPIYPSYIILQLLKAVWLTREFRMHGYSFGFKRTGARK
jgi:glycosyltransferase involved in cell wall biosynthesis